MTSREIKKFALRLNIDTTRTNTVITRSMGNYKEICSFISETPDSLRPLAISLLENLPDKDLRDTRRYVLSDHLINSKVKAKDEVEPDGKFFLEYVLNPRIVNELLVAWRHYFLTKLPPGHYMLVTGNRLDNSNILSNISFFELLENEHRTVVVQIRKDVTEKKVLGNIDLKMIDSLFHLTKSSESCVNDKGEVIIWIDPEKEPTKHIFNDLPLLKSELDAWGGKFIFLGQGTDRDLSLPDAKPFIPDNIKGLPTNIFLGNDNHMTVLKSSIKINPSPDLNLPFVVIADKDGNILFTSAGYRIGIGEQILKYIK